VKAVDCGLGGLHLVEEPVEPPWCKDYDALPEGGPVRWAERWDLRSWGLLIATDEERPVGGAIVAWNTDGVNLLEGRADLAVLWDIRVCSERRGQGIGTQLFGAAAEWARSRGCRELKVETQDINVPACRFYARQGCVLRGIDTRAYRPVLLDEAMLLWHLGL
jgi:GNAT superfamily N-acetyltransferase